MIGQYKSVFIRISNTITKYSEGKCVIKPIENLNYDIEGQTKNDNMLGIL
jgi:hypothetical protein